MLSGKFLYNNKTMPDYVIGVDIGGTNIKAGAVDHGGNILVRKRTPTQASLGSDAIFENITSVIRDIRAEVPQEVQSC